MENVVSILFSNYSVQRSSPLKKDPHALQVLETWSISLLWPFFQLLSMRTGWWENTGYTLPKLGENRPSSTGYPTNLRENRLDCDFTIPTKKAD